MRKEEGPVEGSSPGSGSKFRSIEGLPGIAFGSSSKPWPMKKNVK
jgi:hypothetical protein